MARVIRESQAVGGPLSPLHAEIARAESGLILQVFGGEDCKVDKGFLRAWLVDGRLSCHWSSPKRRIGIRTTSNVGRRIAIAMDSTWNPKRARRRPLGSYRLVPCFLGRELRLLPFGFML